MTFPTHLALGLIIGKATGAYGAALAGSLLIDADHLVSYATNGILLRPKRLWQAMISREDPFGGQRGILHNLLALSLVSVLAMATDSHPLIIFSLGFFGHLLLDALDGSDFWPFFPSRKIVWRGPIAYFSPAEFALTTVLFLFFFLL